MEFLLHSVLESFSRFTMNFNYTTPANRVLIVPRRIYDRDTDIVIQPGSISSHRRGPDDYTPVNLRHMLEEEYVDKSNDIDVKCINKKNN
jgi:hypothetical protein